MFKFHCPHCLVRISAEEEWSGHTSNCPTCGEELVVPNAETPPPIPQEADENTYNLSDYETVSGSTPPASWEVGNEQVSRVHKIIAVAIILIGAIFLWNLIIPKSPPPPPTSSSSYNIPGLQMNRFRSCDVCSGTGQISSGAPSGSDYDLYRQGIVTRCGTCSGQGTMRTPSGHSVVCPDCAGRGKAKYRLCGKCRGAGQLPY